MGQHLPIFSFILFILNKKYFFISQQDLNSDRRSRREGHWPLDHRGRANYDLQKRFWDSNYRLLALCCADSHYFYQGATRRGDFKVALHNLWQLIGDKLVTDNERTRGFSVWSRVVYPGTNIMNVLFIKKIESSFQKVADWCGGTGPKNKSF